VAVGEDTTAHPQPGLLLVWGPNGARHTLFAVDDTLALGRPLLERVGVDDTQVSRQHCELRRVGDEWEVNEIGSRNGTFVDGARVLMMRGAFSVLRIGQCLFLPVDDVTALAEGVLRRDGVISGARLRATWRAVDHAAQTGRALLVTGENGTGKELAAHRFHRAGPSGGGPFVPVHCAALPSDLAERALFGDDDPAGVAGHLRAAHRGVLFLDEVDALALDIQARLLRFLATGEVGAQPPTSVDARVCLATDRDLPSQIAGGHFREDLYRWLARSMLVMPPLRERREEIGWLIADTLRGIDAVMTVHPLLVEQCLLRPWPGNVRELAAAVRTAAGRAHGANRREVGPEDLDPTAGAALDATRPT
jgi:transcriptional regulator of acetoin/glycerol metabolism